MVKLNVGNFGCGVKPSIQGHPGWASHIRRRIWAGMRVGWHRFPMWELREYGGFVMGDLRDGMGKPCGGCGAQDSISRNGKTEGTASAEQM
jgi:hypothetical protein